jgi:Phage derived protein Gp49-like (DUF891)
MPLVLPARAVARRARMRFWRRTAWPGGSWRCWVAANAWGDALALLKLLAAQGNALKMPHSKPLGGGLFELRVGPERLFYTFCPGHRIVLLDGLVKKRQDIPPGCSRGSGGISGPWRRPSGNGTSHDRERAGDGDDEGRRDGVGRDAAGPGRTAAGAGRGPSARAAAGAAAREAPRPAGCPSARWRGSWA